MIKEGIYPKDPGEDEEDMSGSGIEGQQDPNFNFSDSSEEEIIEEKTEKEVPSKHSGFFQRTNSSDVVGNSSQYAENLSSSTAEVNQRQEISEKQPKPMPTTKIQEGFVSSGFNFEVAKKVGFRCLRL